MTDRAYKLGVFAVLMAAAVAFAFVDGPNPTALCLIAAILWLTVE